MDCKTEILNVELDWKLVKNECRNTVNKEPTENEPGHDFKIKLLISEHSPIRLIHFHWRWEAIKSWCATHFARHWLGWDKWIGTRRSDRTGIDRGTLSQDELVPMDVNANEQALINVSRFRLCRMASPETREHMEDVKKTIHGISEECAFVMVPNCIYRGGCPEFTTCGFYDAFLKRHTDIDIADIAQRYQAYNDDFYGSKTNE